MRTFILFIALVASVHLPAQQSRIFLSADQGSNWTSFGEGLPVSSDVRSLTEDGDKLYLATSDEGIFQRGKQDAKWSLLTKGGAPFGENFFQPVSLYVSGDTLLMGTYAHGTFLSFDHGTSWRQPESDVTTMARNFLSTSNGLLCGTDRGIWQSQDGGLNWQPLTKDETRIINGMIWHNGRIIVAEQNALGFLEGEKIAWSNQKSDWAILQLLQQGGFVYACNFRQEIFRSQNGTDWEPAPQAEKNEECLTLTDALWQNKWPEIEQYGTVDQVIPTAFGWVSLLGIGCKLPEN